MEQYVNIDDADPLIAKHAIYWVLSSEAYQQNRRANIDGWAAVMLNIDSIVYGKDNNLIVAFRGTVPSEVDDLWNDYAIGTTKTSTCNFDRASEAFQLLNFLKSDQPGKIISTTGHSLGGAAARCGADSMGFFSVTFNAAAPPLKQTITDENSVNYHIVMDVISAWQYPNTIRIDKGFRPPKTSLFGPLGLSNLVKFTRNAKTQLMPAHSLVSFKKYKPGVIMAASQENKMIEQWWKSLPLTLRKALFGSITKYNPVR